MISHRAAALIMILLAAMCVTGLVVCCVGLDDGPDTIRLAK